jgi:transcriptional regulator with XRE-family HTH domain
VGVLTHGGVTMALSLVASAQQQDFGFPRLLREWRQRRRLSQLDLALSSGVSQRHVSFLESGRARPSRTMILQLSETLDVPLRDRNEWLSAAGFAPVFKARDLNCPQMKQVMGAINMMLKAHEPFPALALDRAWNVRRSNSAFDRLTALLGDDLWDKIGNGKRNLMQLFFHPAGLRPFITNWPVVAPLLWQRAKREAQTLAGTEMNAVLDALAPLQDHHVLWSAAETALLPVMPFMLQFGEVKLSMFAIIATFGTAQDVTAEELRIETLFPADAETEIFFRAMPLNSVL